MKGKGEAGKGVREGWSVAGLAGAVGSRAGWLGLEEAVGSAACGRGATQAERSERERNSGRDRRERCIK